MTARARVGDPKWSAGCAFADLDRDGDLDLWVANYVDARIDNNPFCGDAAQKMRFYCHPLNTTRCRTRSTATTATARSPTSAESGVGALRQRPGRRRRRLRRGRVAGRVRGQRQPPNFLFRNDAALQFTEAALPPAWPSPADGKPRAGMGIDAGDYDGDGRLDLVVTNLDFQMHTLFRGLGKGLFGDATIESGIGSPTLPFVGFGVAFLDFDNDAQLDIAIANGHVLDNAASSGRARPTRSASCCSGTTAAAASRRSAAAGPGFAAEKVGRGAGRRRHRQRRRPRSAGHQQRPAAELLRNDGAAAQQRAARAARADPRATASAIGARAAH